MTILGSYSVAWGNEVVASEATAPKEERRLYIREFRVGNVREIPRVEVEAAVYPFMGPARTLADIERAREAVEKLYHENGFEAASVEVPEQHGRGGIIYLKVNEGRVAKLRVRGARWFSPNDIKRQAPSLAEGKALNFNNVKREILALNQLSDRRVTPSLKGGEEPGTVEIDLEVKDTFPLHGSIELNNRYSADTSHLRLNGSLNYGNLWQLGHGIGASYQMSPEDANEVEVFSGYYLLRVPSWTGLSFLFQGSKQNSNVSTLGSVAVAGKGETVGSRILYSLPSGGGFIQNLSFGVDYKHYNNAITMADVITETPLTYFPFTLSYSAMHTAGEGLTEFNASLIWSFRGLGSSSDKYDANRYGADGSFIYIRSDVSRTQRLPYGFELYGKVQGQLSGQPLVSNEQFGGGGLGTVRGYLEAEAVGDNALFGSVELRTPQILGWLKSGGNQLQTYLFTEGGIIGLNEPLPEQESRFKLASVGFGGRMQLLEYLNGSLDVALPLTSLSNTEAHRPFLTFRVWADF